MNNNYIGEKKSPNNSKHILRIMRITVFLLFLSIMFSHAATSHSQEAMLSLELKSTTIREACREIEKQTGLLFVFADNTEETIAESVNIRANNEPISTILDNLFANTKLKYKILDKQIVIFKDETKAIVPSGVIEPTEQVIQQQKRTITGRITDNNGETVIGANIIEVGTTNGTVTDVDGNFSLSVEANANIRVSYIGYLSQTINTTGRTSFNIVLQEDAQTLDEVVAVGYGTMRKLNLTGAVSTVNAENLANHPVTNSAQLMYGQFAGVQLTQSTGLAGKDQSSVVIRGIGTFGESTPLVVIDGMQYSDMGAFNNLAASDIESISVLKDASASAIYGARGANGVIVVTTKKGTIDAFKVEYNAYYGMQEATVIPEFLDAVTYAELMNEKFKNEAGGMAYNPRYTEEQMEMIRTGSNPDQFANTNWAEEALQSAPVQNHYLSLSGGKGKTSYLVSLGFLDQDAILVGKFSSKRYNLRLNLESQIGEWLNVQNTMASYWKHFQGPAGADAPDGQDDVFEGDNGLLYQFSRAAPTIPVYYSNGEYGYVDGAYNNINPSMGTSNIIKRSNFGNYESDQINISERLALTAQLTEGLSFETSGTVKINFENISNFAPTDETRDFDGVVLNVGEINTLTNRLYFDYRLTNENILRYSAIFNENHDVSFMLGHSVIYDKSDGFSGSLRKFPSNNIEEFDGGGVLDANVTGGLTETAWQSFFGRVNYNYRGRYLFEGNIRRDGSSKFGPENRYGTFPSASAGWRVSDEPFFTGLSSVINDFKLRASWGKSGNDRIGNYIFDQTYNAGLDYILGDDEVVSAVALTRLANPKITWETTKQFDIGLDASFLNNKIYLTSDYFERKSTDILYTAFPIPSSLGVTNLAAQNAASMINRGLEVALGYRESRRPFKYAINVNVTHMLENRVTDLGPGGEETIGFSDIIRIGEPIRAYYGYETIGIFQNADEVAAAPVQFGSNKTAPGDIQFKDQLTVDTDGDGIPDATDGVINADDRVVIGNPHPKWMYNFNADFSFQNIDFKFLFQGLGGVDRLMRGNGHLPFTDDRRNSLSYWKERWTEEKPSMTLPRVGNFNNHQISTFYMQDGSYLRLKNVEIGYTFPKSFIGKIGIQKLRLYLSAQNPLTFTKMEHYDPERPNADSGARQAPLYKVYSAGINLTL